MPKLIRDIIYGKGVHLVSIELARWEYTGHDMESNKTKWKTLTMKITKLWRFLKFKF